MSDGLRVMIYDNTDVKGWTEELKKLTPDGIDGIIDDLDIQLGLSHSWLVGGRLYRAFGRFDHVKGFASWGDALEWLCNLEPEKSIDEIQFWGHGSPGKVWINGRPLHKDSPAEGPFVEHLQRLKTRLHEDSLLWLRCCSIFCAQAGHDFAKAWTQHFGCRIAAHTFIIGPWQAGLYCMKPGVEPWWSKFEGINEGTPRAPKSLRWSMPWCPRGIPAFKSRLPAWAGPDPLTLPA